MSDERQEPQAHYQAVLADLRARRSQLDQAIAAIENILNLTGGGVTGAGAAPMDTPASISSVEQIPSDAFFNMATPEAIKKYLAMVKKKQSAKQIAEALERGGVTHTSKNFYTTAYTALARLADAGDVVKVGKDWGLAAWYPGSRGRMRTKAASANGTAGDGPEGGPSADEE